MYSILVVVFDRIAVTLRLRATASLTLTATAQSQSVFVSCQNFTKLKHQNKKDNTQEIEVPDF